MAAFYSASAIVGSTVTMYYVYQIDGYSRTKELPNGKKIQSPTFWVGDYSWRISCYPSGARIPLLRRLHIGLPRTPRRRHRQTCQGTSRV